MKGGEKNKQVIHQLLLLSALLFSGLEASALSYDYTASVECLENPHKPQYGGGVIINSELNEGLEGWSAFGDAKMEHKISATNNFVVAHSRFQPFDSVSQTLHLENDKLYTFSAWIQVSEGKTSVRAVFKTKSGYKHAGSVVAKANCWSMLKGGVTVDESGPADLYFESNNTSVDIWVDSISLQPFTQEEWKSHQDESVNKMRKRKVRIQAVDTFGKPVANATVSVSQKRLGFPFGCAVNQNILGNTAYQNWFSSRFTVTTFENEMKWASIESTRGIEDYSIPDAMLKFTKSHGIGVRGHNVLWEDPQYLPRWVDSLSTNDLKNAVTKRIYSIMRRYRGQVIGWDVVNENLHFSFFESKLGARASELFYAVAQMIDPTHTMFMNEFNTVEESRDSKATPSKYLEKLRSIKSSRSNTNLGIGLESHFGSGAPNLPYMRSAIDTLAATGLPIWLTEVDVQSGGDQAKYLEQILREGHSHPKVNGIVMWSAWSPQGCYRMCLTDNNFRNLATGDVVDKLLHEWGGRVEGKTDVNGFFEVSLFHGDYEVNLTPSTGLPSSSSFKLASTDGEPHQTTLLVRNS